MTRKILILFVFFLLQNKHVYSQIDNAFPAFQIDNLRANDYLGNVQVWDIVEGNDNKIFITTANGLSVFDGIRWDIYSVPESPLFRCIDYDPATNHLYVGADNQFGFWYEDDYGQYKYTSLYVNANLEKHDIFWRVYVIGDHVYYQTEQSVFRYSKTNQTIDTIIHQKQIGYLHELNNRLYIQMGHDLFEIVDKSIVSIGLSSESRIINLFGTPDQLIAATERNGLLVQREKQLVAMNRTTNLALQESVIFSAKLYSDSIYLIGTVLDGIYLLDLQGRIIDKISQEEGLRYTTVLSIYVDNRKNIWLGLDGGLGKVAPSNLLTEQVIDFSKSAIGRVYAMTYKQDNLYFGTNKGLYIQTKNNQLHLIPHTQGQVWNIIAANNQLIVCHDKGVFSIVDEGIKWMKVPPFWTMKPLNIELGYYLSVDYEGGFSLYHIKNDEIVYLKKLTGYAGAHTSFDVDRYGDIWVIDRLLQPVQMIINKTLWDIDKVNKYSLPSLEKDLKASILDGDIVFFNDSIAYKYDKLDNSIVKDFYYSELLKQAETVPIVFTQENDYFFYLSAKQLGVIKRENNQFFNYGTVLKNEDIKTIPPLGRKFIYTSPTSIAIGLQDRIGLYNINNSVKNEKQYLAFFPTISKIELDVKGSTVLLPIDYKDRVYELPYSYFRLNIYLSNLASNNQIAYRINNGNWIITNADPFFQLPYLDKGNHTVEIKNLGLEDDLILTLQIRVKSPWYLSPYFFVFVFVVLILCGFLLTYFSQLRIKKQRLKYEEEQRSLWEKEKNEHQIKLLKLKLNEEEKKLINTTMYAIKRNAMLSKIRDEVASIIPLFKDPVATQKGKNAVKTIDSYLDNKENWTVFEKYFNNIYDGFFDRLMQKHPTITPNETKLCALIKLNFPTKEIATYFNISESSVEIARYRLRKKLQMEHEQSLFTYILSI